MNMKEVTETDKDIRINIRHNYATPGLNARKVWEVLFRRTDISKAGTYDSFLCDLVGFERCFQQDKAFYWEMTSGKSGWTGISLVEPSSDYLVESAYKIEIVGNEIVITKPTGKGKK